MLLGARRSDLCGLSALAVALRQSHDTFACHNQLSSVRMASSDVVTPTWVREVTDCSRGLSSRLAKTLVAEVERP